MLPCCHTSVRLHLVSSQTLHLGTVQRVEASNPKALCPLLPQLVGFPDSRHLGFGQVAALSAAGAARSVPGDSHLVVFAASLESMGATIKLYLRTCCYLGGC